ncbi:MAG: secretin and TonB N-terminal domain-containing protein [Fusobacteria bacterium]|nr:secretin and TonB N-terminal domain-containing protein [Fusobacteriota bacterium]
MRKKFSSLCIASVLMAGIALADTSGGSNISGSSSARPQIKTYTLNINSNLQGAFQMLSGMVNQNIILASSVQAMQPVNVDIKGMTFEQILDILLLTNNLGSQKIGNSILVYPQNMAQSFAQTQMVYIPLTDMNANDVVNLVRQYLNGNYGESISPSPNLSGVVVNATPEHIKLVKDIILQLEANNVTITKTYYLTYTKAQDVYTALQGLTSIKNMIVNQDMNTLTVEMPNSLEPQVNYIVDSYNIEQPQVVIKVLILATTNAVMEDLGWDYDNTTTISGGFGSLGYLTISGIPNTLIGTLSTGTTKILSNPTLRILNNQKATIKVGQNIPIIIQQPTPQTTPSSSTTNQPVAQLQVEYKDAGLTLNLTPTIHGDNRITIAVDLVKKDPGKSVVQGGYQYPSFITQSINTDITLNNTESVIFGGLIQNGEETTVTTLPIIGSIPYIGSLFSNTRTNPTQTELIMLITPYIVTNIQDGKSVSYNYFDSNGNNDVMAQPAQEKANNMQKKAIF